MVRRSALIPSLCLTATLCLLPAPPAHAKKAAFNVTGHWEGTYRDQQGNTGPLMFDLLAGPGNTVTGELIIGQAGIPLTGKITPSGATTFQLTILNVLTTMKGHLKKAVPSITGKITFVDQLHRKLKGTFTLSRTAQQ